MQLTVFKKYSTFMIDKKSVKSSIKIESDYLHLTIRKKTFSLKLTTHHNLDEKSGE